MKDFVDWQLALLTMNKANRAANFSQLWYLAMHWDANCDDKIRQVPEQIARWGPAPAMAAKYWLRRPLNPNERVVEGLMDFVGKRYSDIALPCSREDVRASPRAHRPRSCLKTAYKFEQKDAAHGAAFFYVCHFISTA